VASFNPDGSGGESNEETTAPAALALGHEIYSRHISPGIVLPYVATKIMRQMNLGMNRLPVLHDIAQRHAMTDALLPGPWQSLPFVLNRFYDAAASSEGNINGVSHPVYDPVPHTAAPVEQSHPSNSDNAASSSSAALPSSSAPAKGSELEATTSPQIHVHRKPLSPTQVAEDVNMGHQPSLLRTGMPSANSESSSTGQIVRLSNHHVLSARPFIFRSAPMTSATVSQRHEQYFPAPFRYPFTAQRKTSAVTPAGTFVSPHQAADPIVRIPLSVPAVLKSVGMSTHISRAVSQQNEIVPYRSGDPTHPNSPALVLPHGSPSDQPTAVPSPETIEVGLPSPAPIVVSQKAETGHQSSGLESSTTPHFTRQPPLIMRALASRTPHDVTQDTPVAGRQMAPEIASHGPLLGTLAFTNELTLERVPQATVGDKRPSDVTSPGSGAEQRNLQEDKSHGDDSLVMRTVESRPGTLLLRKSAGLPGASGPEATSSRTLVAGQRETRVVQSPGTEVFRKSLALQPSPAEDHLTTPDNSGIRDYRNSSIETSLPFVSAMTARAEHQMDADSPAESQPLARTPLTNVSRIFRMAEGYSPFSSRDSSARCTVPSFASLEPPLVMTAGRYPLTPSARTIVSRATDPSAAKPEMIWRSVANTVAPGSKASGYADAIPDVWSRYEDGQYIARQTSSSSPSAQISPQPPTASGAGGASGGMDMARIAEQVSRLISKQLIVERERRGVSKWQ
jgi:hypothetical protein